MTSSPIPETRTWKGNQTSQPSIGPRLATNVLPTTASNPTERYMDIDSVRKNYREVNHDQVDYLTIVDDNGQPSYLPILPDPSNPSKDYSDLGEGYYYPGIPVQEVNS